MKDIQATFLTFFLKLKTSWGISQEKLNIIQAREMNVEWFL